MCIRTIVKETEMEEGACWEEGVDLGTCYRNETQKTLPVRDYPEGTIWLCECPYRDKSDTVYEWPDRK